MHGNTNLSSFRANSDNSYENAVMWNWKFVSPLNTLHTIINCLLCATSKTYSNVIWNYTAFLVFYRSAKFPISYDTVFFETWSHLFSAEIEGSFFDQKMASYATGNYSGHKYQKMWLSILLSKLFIAVKSYLTIVLEGSLIQYGYSFQYWRSSYQNIFKI